MAFLRQSLILETTQSDGGPQMPDRISAEVFKSQFVELDDAQDLLEVSSKQYTRKLLKGDLSKPTGARGNSLGGIKLRTDRVRWYVFIPTIAYHKNKAKTGLRRCVLHIAQADFAAVETILAAASKAETIGEYKLTFAASESKADDSEPEVIDMFSDDGS